MVAEFAVIEEGSGGVAGAGMGLFVMVGVEAITVLGRWSLVRVGVQVDKGGRGSLR